MTNTKVVLAAMPGGGPLPGWVDGSAAELSVRADGVTVEVEIRIPGPVARAVDGVELGQIAYEAYLVSCDYTSVRGEPLPSWEQAQPEIRAHWRAAADRVAMWMDLQSRRVQ